MTINSVVDGLRARKSVRKYKPDPVPDQTLETILRAGQQAPFASQLYSVLRYKRKRAPFGAPVWLAVCADCHKLELFMKERGWEVRTNDLSLLLFAVQDASYAAQNIVTAAESLGLGSCFLGAVSMEPGRIRAVARDFKLPPRVLPVVELVLGYPDEDRPPRPRYPLDFAYFVGTYPELGPDRVRAAMRVMDEGYLAQDYYARMKAKLPLEDGRPETFTYKDYSWTEHISRKWGQWATDPSGMLEALAERGFHLGPGRDGPEPSTA